MVWDKNTVRRRGLVFSIMTIIACMPLTHAAGVGTCTPPPSGMVSWWPGDGNANDIAGSNNGSFAGAGTAPGLVGDAFSFNGSGAYVSVPAGSSLDFSRELTLDAWIFIDNDAPSNMGIVSKYYPVSDHRGYFLSIASDKLGLRASNQDETLSCDQISSGNVPRGEWVHVATTVSSSACRLYMNGVLVSSTAGIPNIRINPNVPNLIIGAHGFGDLAHFKGLIDEVEAFDRELTQDEIQAIYAAGANGKCKNQSCATPPTSMVSWYRAENNALDAQGANDGTATGGVNFAAGKVGQAFDFDGSTGSVSFGNPSSLQFSNAITVDAWVRPDNGTGFKYTVAKWKAGGSNSSWLLAINGASPRVFVLGNGGPGGSFTEVEGSPIPTGPSAALTHVAMTYSATDILRLYVNGAQVGTGVNVGTIANTSIQDVRIGSAVDTPGGEFFDGLVDEVEIFDRALTATEIKEIYDAGANGKCVEANLDLGDAPEPYPTLLADDGAHHSATGPLLGTERDTESDGQPSAAADGDGDDEDGIATPIILAVGKDDIITVTIGENDGPVDGFLNVWIDFDNDGSWAEAGDQVLLDEPVTSGSYTVAVPAEATKGKPLGTYYGRLRICSTAENCSSPTGAADDGEVEDYAITLSKHSPGSKRGGSSDGGGGILAVDPVLLALFGLMGLWGLRRGKNSGL